jgi:phosphinothricin acetyltransferase
MTERDWREVRAIYESGIATGHATFQTEAPSWDDWGSRPLVELVGSWRAMIPASSSVGRP